MSLQYGIKVIRLRHLGIFLFVLLQFSLVSNPLSARKFALILATNYTANKASIPPLKLCERDASLIKKNLQKKGNFDRVEVLLGPMVTARNVGKKIGLLAKTVTKNDTVMIYFSGHGTYQNDASAVNGMRNFLLMHQRPHLPDNLLDKWVRKIKTKKLVWIFDCCYSGGIASKSKRSRGSGSVPIARNQPGKVIENGDEALYFGNKAIIASSSANQTAIEIGFPVNHGVFTYFFAKSFDPKNGDLNQDGTVTLLEAFEWTKPRVTEMAQRYKHVQTPILGGDASGFYLAGREKPKPPIQTEAPPSIQAIQVEKPKPAAVQPEPTVIHPAQPIGTAEPPVVPHKNTSTVLLYTTIFKSSIAGPTPLDPKAVIARNKQKNKTRKIAVSLSDKNYPIQIKWLGHKSLRIQSKESIPLGVYSHRGRVYKNRVAKITINDVPTGVHSITLKADGYPIIKRRLGVEKDSTKNKLFIVASLAGYGTIRGTVFFKSFDKPLGGQKIYMPTISQTNQIHSMTSASDGSFWFLNLLPGNNYYLKASFAENLPLDNKKLKVKANTTTKVDVVLKRKL